MKFKNKTKRELVQQFEEIEYAKAAQDWKLNWEATMHEEFSGDSHILQSYPVLYNDKQLLYYSIQFEHEAGMYRITLARDVDIADSEDLIANSFDVWEDDSQFESVIVQMIQHAKSKEFKIEKVA